MTRTRLYTLLLMLCLTALLIHPNEATNSARDALLLCFNVIIPSLFPFFVLSKMMIDTGAAELLSRLLQGIMKPLFNVNGMGGTALAMGLIGGYPVGAQTAVSLYEKQLCTKKEAQRMLAFCNNAGPAFIFGFVGAGVFSSPHIGVVLYLTHITASVTIGVLFRWWGGRMDDNRLIPTKSTEHASANPVQNFSSTFTNAVTSSFGTTLNICAFVIFFTVGVRILVVFGILPLIGNIFTPLGLNDGTIHNLLSGLIEMTGGLRELHGNITVNVTLAAFMLGWAGLSVHAQVLSFLSKSDLGVKTYLYGKVLHAFIGAGYAWIALHFFQPHIAISTIAAEQAGFLANLQFYRTFILTMQIIAVAAIILFALHLTFRQSGRE